MAKNNLTVIADNYSRYCGVSPSIDSEVDSEDESWSLMIAQDLVDTISPDLELLDNHPYGHNPLEKIYSKNSLTALILLDHYVPKFEREVLALAKRKTEQTMDSLIKSMKERAQTMLFPKVEPCVNAELQFVQGLTAEIEQVFSSLGGPLQIQSSSQIPHLTSEQASPVEVVSQVLPDVDMLPNCESESDKGFTKNTTVV